MTTQIEARESGARLHDLLMSGQDKTAAQELTDHTRLFHREASFLSKIIEPTPFDAARIVPQPHTDQPIMYFEYEVPSPGAVQVDFGTAPTDFIPRGRRYPVTLQKTQTRQSVFDTLHLHSYGQDVRAIMGDAKAKDLAARNDAKLIRGVKDIVGTVGQVLNWTGQAMHLEIGAAMDYRSWLAGSQTTLSTEYAVPSKTVLMHHLRRIDMKLLAVEELQGTDKSVDVMFNGWTEAKFDEFNLLFTIKQNYVPLEETFWFAQQEWLGRYVEWIEPTMEIKREDTRVMFYLYQVNGLTIANPAAVAVNRYLR